LARLPRRVPSLKTLQKALAKEEHGLQILQRAMVSSAGSHTYIPGLSGDSDTERVRLQIQRAWDRIAHLKALLQLKQRTTAETVPQPAAVPAEINPGAEDPRTRAEQRDRLLAEYRAAVHCSNKQIYEARNSGIHKPQFYQWVKGQLLPTSATSRNFERFLREKKPPIPKTPRI
jgi:hypothetical protein